ATTAECPDGYTCSPQGLCSTQSACTAITPQQLAVTLSGDGRVTSDPPGIDCGTMCSAEFPPQSTVTLTAAPNATSIFDSWTGDCSGSGPCSLVMDARKTVGAKFAMHGERRWVQQISFSGDDYSDGKLEVDANGDIIVAGSVDDGGTPTFYAVKYAKADG